MAFVHLDQAARQVGKSEVTVRRLVKAGKISHRKEKTLTGFIYLVDPTEISHYYGDRGSSSEDFAQQLREAGAEVVEEVRVHHAKPLESSTEDHGEQAQAESGSTRQIRVAVASESGNLSEYWQKRAETYENRYHQTLETQSKLREELGVWRGRAEQAQNMLVKLLPAPAAPTSTPEPEKEPEKPVEPKKAEKPENSSGTWVVALLAVIAGLFAVALTAAAFYVLSR